MYQPINSDGLSRLAHLELTRVRPKSQEEARTHLVKRFGVYDRDGDSLERGLVSYYKLPH